MFMLNEIVANKRLEIENKKRNCPLEELMAKLSGARQVRDFHHALTMPGISLIAEIKRKSPSKGELRPGFDAIELARIYSEHGARAISVLADEKFFGGGAHVVEKVANDPFVRLPVMYKEFVIDPYQIYEARSVGADAVLLIVRCIEQPSLLSEMIEIIHSLGMQALVECFAANEAVRAVESGARIIGINNRDLQTFDVDLKRSEEIRSVLPDSAVTVSESGLSSRSDALLAQENGFDAMLVGEALLKSDSIVSRVREFAGLGELEMDVLEHKNV
ncbi:indole-3-glycerol phosphate synthase TrpC [Paenibacillus sp. sptzw28]|uniref:indole-3-glycerol phosphate synthase TrpC n=1 Tax=Paenibacillus sp. sptzw28 TaxID=715179 RepID=UPI001C6F27C3|nr:indole-3-glycerol phosphate synthase TrpC [Paenibacillus sp. sptzw28]QYR23479.1 indole-3-glycerol phosphate synthase TrpC [Paenibacillus sp. sptzw28]